jgi:hypothetical protein
MNYPQVLDSELVGSYEAVAKAGGGYVWDEVLEYRVFCHPHKGADDLYDGDDYFYPFDTYSSAFEFSNSKKGTSGVYALVLQKEYIDEPEQGNYTHIKEERITEWTVEFLSRPRRNKDTIPNFMDPNAPSNKLDIIRGIAK